MRNLTVMIKNRIAPYYIGLNTIKDHRSSMVLRILSLMHYLPITKILLNFKKQLKALKRING